MSAEEELSQQILIIDTELKYVRSNLSKIKADWSQTETKLIELKLDRAKLLEKLNKIKDLNNYLSTHDVELANQELARLRNTIPGLVKKIKDE